MLYTVKLTPSKGKIIKNSFVAHGSVVAKVIAIDRDTIRLEADILEYEANKSAVTLLKYTVHDEKDNLLGELAYSNYNDISSYNIMGDEPQMRSKLDDYKFYVEEDLFKSRVCKNSISIGEEVYISCIPLSKIEEIDKKGIVTVDGIIFHKNKELMKGTVIACNGKFYTIQVGNKVTIQKRNCLRLANDTKLVFTLR